MNVFTSIATRLATASLLFTCVVAVTSGCVALNPKTSDQAKDQIIEELEYAKEISLDQVKALPDLDYDDSLYFSSLKSLSPEVAMELVKKNAYYLSFPELEDLTPLTARALATYERESNYNFTLVQLNGLDELSLEVAHELKNFKGYIELDGLRDIDLELALILADFKSISISLNGLKSMPPEIANALAQYTGNKKYYEDRNGGFSFDGLEVLSPEIAEILPNFKAGTLSFENVTSISPEIASALVKFNGHYINLSGLSSISLEAATILGSSKKNISLTGLQEISTEIAEALYTRNAKLSLNGLTTITPEMARIFASNGKRSLSLGGLKNMSPDVARELAKYPGPDYREGRNFYFILDGFKTIDSDIAEILAQSKAELWFRDMTCIDLESARALANSKGGGLFQGLRCVSPEALEILESSSKVKISNKFKIKRPYIKCKKSSG